MLCSPASAVEAVFFDLGIEARIGMMSEYFRYQADDVTWTHCCCGEA